MTINKPDPTRELMFLVTEMEFIENLIVKETTRASEQTNNELAKNVFLKWAHDSELHSQTLHHVAEKLQKRHASSKPSIRGLGVIDLRDVAQMHLRIEGDAEKRYGQMAEMSDDEELKKVFTELVRAESWHHHEAQLLSDSVDAMIEDDAKRRR